MKSVLFVCIHNSARSQMAEAFVNVNCAGSVTAQSAGLVAGTLNPFVVEVMRELGYDLSRNATKTVNDDAIRSGRYDYVITVCDEGSAEGCPIVPAEGERLHWSFPDPSSITGDHTDVLARTREVRDAIAARLRVWCVTAC